MVHKRKQPPIHLNSPKLFKFNVICDTDNDQKQVDIVQKETGLDQDDLINSLPDDALITIFEMLSCVDRLNVEAVSHRWRRLALNRSWSQFKHFSIEYLTRVVYDPRMKSSKQLSLLRDKLNPGGIYYLNITWFESLFRRCSSYIQELVLTDFHCFRHRNVTLLKTLKRDFWNMDFSGIIPVAGNQQSQNLKIEAAEQDYNESPAEGLHANINQNIPFMKTT
uniref:F-box domain-containing protein n=1 Tax=Ditylenchus dipsaci TaxID=166011 RepID=A0A915EMX0_9BILA